jgi:hypothetical protein
MSFSRRWCGGTDYCAVWNKVDQAVVNSSHRFAPLLENFCARIPRMSPT